MKNIINIFIKPKETIENIISSEPIFSGILVFIVAVSVANTGILSGFAINWHSTLFYSLILILLWLGGLIIGDLIITGLLKIINPLSSSILDAERFRKLIVTQFFISGILIVKPILTLVLSPRLAWILISIWVVVLTLIAIVELWSVTEIKAVIAVAVSIIGVYVIFNYLFIKSNNFETANFKKFKMLSEKKLPVPKVSLLGIRKTDISTESAPKLKDISENYIKSHNKNYVYGYALALKAEALMREGEVEEAENVYRDILALDRVTPELVNSVKFSLYNIISPEQFVLLYSNMKATIWYPVLKFLNIPVRLSGYRPNVRDAGLAADMIKNSEVNEFKSNLGRLISNWDGTVFEDDLLFWAGKRFLEEGEKNKAALYFRKAGDNHKYKDSERIKAESVLYLIERLAGEVEIYKEKFRAPQALYELAKIHKSDNDISKAKSVYKNILENFPSSIFAADSLFELAQISEEEGEFKNAIKLYSKLLNQYEISNLRGQATHKKNIITKNLNNKPLLADYSRGWKLWQSGKFNEAIQIYKNVIENYRNSEIAYELQYNLGNYYRDEGDHMQSLHEFRSGYRDFKNTPRGFDFARQIGNVLGDDLKYWRRAVNWYRDVYSDYEPGYSSEFSNVYRVDIAWKAADIAREHLRDFREAKSIYADIIKEYSDKNIAARAVYETAYIDEVIYGRYSDSVSQYRKIITGYPNTKWKELAEKRMEDIYRRGTQLLERYR